MQLYLFDTRENDRFVEDNVSVEFPDLSAVRSRRRARLPS